METLDLQKQNNKYLTVIGVLSVAIPLVVAFLLFIPQTGKLGDVDVSFLPGLNAVLNSATALCLVLSLYFIKAGNIQTHKTFNLAAMVLSSIFLVSYVIYHFQAPSTKFGDVNGDHVLSDIEKASAGGIRYFYYVLLITHIILAAVVVPFVLRSLYFGWTRQDERHRKLSKITWPIWFFVAVSGVVVYLLISPYYQH